MKYGICTHAGDAKALADLGYDYFEWSVGDALQPAKGDGEWEARKREILAAPIPLYACNGFLPGTFRLTGPAADHAPALDYAEKACRRADEVGCAMIVFGSGGARNIPCGEGGATAEEAATGLAQFKDFCAALAARIADCRVTVVIEPLRRHECNLVNFVSEATQIVKEVGSPRLQVLADFYHMICGGEGPQSMLEAGPLLRHCHVAESASREYPGHGNPDELAPYFAALAEIGYEGGVSCECAWSLREGLTLEGARANALAVMRRLSGR